MEDVLGQAQRRRRRDAKKGETTNQSRIIARLDSRMMLSSKSRRLKALRGDTKGTFGERKTRRMSTPAPSCPDERWVYSSAFAEEEEDEEEEEEEEVETRAKTPAGRRKSCAFANGGGGARRGSVRVRGERGGAVR